MKDHVADLYRALVNGGYNVDDLGGSVDGFREAMSDSVMRKEFYDWVGRRKNFSLPDYDTYESALASTYDGLTSEVTAEEAKENTDSINQFLENRDTMYTGLQDYNTGVVSGTEQRRRDAAVAEAEAQAEAMRERLQADDTIDRMKESKNEARRDKLRAFGSMLGSAPQVTSFGVSTNVFDSTDEQLADVGQALDAGTEYRQNKLLQEKLDVALDMARAGENQDGLRGVENFGLGLWDSATRLSTWDFGASDIVNNLTLQQIVEKWENDPSSLTATEQKVLEGIGMATAVQELYSDQVGVGYNVGQSLPESASFMMGMALNPASGLGKSLARNAVRTYGRNSIAKNLARIGGDIAETAIMTATTGAGRVAADALERINGSSTYEIGENGVIMYGGQKDQETVGNAVIKAIGANFIENYSEALGEYFDPLLGMSRKVAAGGLRKMNLNKWADALSDVQPSQMTASIRSLREKTKFGGIFGEIMEEEIDMALNTLFVGDNKWSDFVDLETQLTTVLSCAIMSGTLNGVEQVSSAAARRKMEKNAKNAEQEASYRFSSDKFAPLREAIDQASPEGMVDVLRDVYMSQEYTVGQKRALAEYAAARLQLQYYNAADAKARRQVNKTQQELLDAQEAGLNAQLPQFFNIARAAQSAEDDLVDYDGDWNLVEIIRSSMNRPEEMERILGDLPPREVQLVTNYIYSRARMEGAYQGRSNRAEDYIDDFAYTLEPAVVTDVEGNRTITTAIMGERPVYVLDNNGDLAHIMRPDGSKTLVKASELTNITTSSADEVIDRYRDMYTSEYNAETENAFEHHPKTQAPRVGLQLQSPEGEVVITAINDNMVEIVPAVYKDGQVQPKEGAEPRTITVDDAYAWQDDYYLSMDADQAYANAMAEANNMSAETTENESTPTEQIEQSVSEEVADGQNIEIQPTEEAVESVAPAAPQTARERVPKDDKGNPIYEQTDADTAWDAIVEETEGNVEMAQRVAADMLEDKKAALAKLQNGKPKKGATVAEKIANEKAHAAAIAQAQSDVAQWEAIVGTENRRREAAMSEVERYAAEMEQKNISEGLKALGEPQSLEEYVLGQLAGGAYKLRWSDKENGTKGFGSHTGLSTEEMKARLLMIDNKNGLTPEEIAHSIVENMDASFGEVDVMDVTNMVIDAVATNASRRAMLNGMVESRAELLRQQARAEQEAKDAWYMEQYHATEEELAAYNEYLAEFAEEIYGEDTDYEQRIATFAEIQLGEYDNQGTDADLRSSADQGEGLASDREGGRSVGETEQLDRREILADANGVAEAEDQGVGSSVSEESDVIETIKSELGVFSADNAAEYAARMFEIYKWKTLEEANESLKQLLASYGQKLDGQTLGVVPFLDAAQDQINAERDWQRYQEDLAADAAETVETLENGDVRRTNRNSRGEIATVAIERDGKFISVDSYDDGVLFERTDYDENGQATKVTRFNDKGEVVSEQEYKDGKRKVTANYFEMAEEAQKNRKSNKKSNDTARRSIQESPAEADRVSGEIFGGESLGEGGSVSARSDGGILEEGAGKKKRTAKTRRQSDNRQEARDGKAERLSRGISAVQQQAIDEYTRINPWDANLTDDERGVLNMYRMATLNELDALAHKLADKINSGKATPRDRMRYDVLAAYAKSGELKAVADAMGVEYGKTVSLDTIKSLFETFNSDADLAKLFDRVFPLVNKINPTIIYRRFTEADIEEGEDVLPDDILGQYSLQENLIEYNRNQIDSNHCTEQEKASTIVHEMIHAVARYAIRVQEAHNNGVELDIQLPKRLLDAAQSLIEVYDAIKDNEIFNDDRYESGKMYGVSSVHEMLSELADPEFREKLKQVSIENLPSDKKGRVRDALRAIKDFIHRMFGWDSSSAYARTKRALDKLIDNYDSAGYNKARELSDDDFAQQRTYHGSGSLFDKFNHSFMGTGEGHQAFGWGTYVTEVEDIGRIYAENSPALFNIKYAENDYNRAKDKVEFYERELDGQKSAKYPKDILSMTENALNSSLEELKEAEERYLIQKRKYGRVLYSVEIPDDNGHNYLEWYDVVENKNEIKKRLYERLSEGQGEAYKEELKQEINDVFRFSDNNGKSVYNNLAAYLGGARAASKFLNEMGYVGIKYPTGTLSGGNTDNSNNYVIFNEDDLEIVDNLRFRDGSPLYSNAERAVENIKQNKATPEQWLAMIKKDGGLKAGEDKWMGLSDWLNEKKEADVKSLTKDEVLEFIRANEIQIEEVNYAQSHDYGYDEDYNAIAEEIDDAWDDYVYEAQREIVSYGEYNEYDDVPMEQVQGIVREKIKDMYGDDIFDHIEIDEVGNVFVLGETKPINSTRLDYTTEGLDNKKEIAFVVPTIESWNKSDEVHFGDAGEGRAVAWVRFGETTDADGKRVLVIDEVQSKRHDEGRAKGYKPSREDVEKATEAFQSFNRAMKEKYGDTPAWEWSEEEQAELTRLTREHREAARKYDGGIPDAPFDKNYHELIMKRMLRYAAENGFDKVAWTKGAQQAKRYDLAKHVSSIEYKPLANGHYNVIAYSSLGYPLDGVPMVYDSEQAIADVFGKDIAQQIAQDVEENRRKAVETEQALSELKEKRKELRRRGVDEDSAEFEETLEEFSRLSNELSETQSAKFIEGTDLSIGGDDRVALYDEMIPRFMNKYVKKWGTKVGEVALPNVEAAGRTMWSVDVTPEMKESVMQGQPMFREGMGAISDREISYENDPIAKFQGKPRYYGKRAAAFAERERRRMENAAKEAAEMLGIEAEIITDASTLQGRKAKAKGWYDIINKKVIVVVPNHVSMGDAVRTVLHEGVAHHGLRELFGDGFDAMLDNVYNNVAPELKARIDAIAERTGVSTSVATEEYLASLAETNNFEEAQRRGWWAKIKQYFVKMLHKLGMPGLNLKEELTDNELRYLLWRSYKNLVEPNSYMKPLGYIDDVAKQKELKVGEYAEKKQAAPMAAEMSEAEEWSAITMQRIEELETQMAQLDSEIAEMEADRDADDESRYDIWEEQLDVLNKQRQEIYDELEGLYSLEAEDQDIEDYEAERESEKQRQLYQKRIDNAYLKAVREGDWEEATDLFRQYVLSKAEDDGIVPMDYGVGYRGGAHSSIAKKVKEENPDAIAEAAYQMSIRIPKGSILVPMPSRTGNATYTVKLAEAIAKATDSEVRDVLKGKARMSVYEAKQKGIKMTPEDLGMYTTEELPKGKNIVIIDNVIDKGTTALAAVSAVKGASVVAYAYTLGDKQRVATLKLAEPVTYDDNMRIIPLSRRFDKETDDIRYRENGEMLFSPQELAEMETPIHKSKGGFKNLAEAEAWAKANLQGQTRANQFTGDEISVNRKSVNEMLAPKFTKRISEDVHMKALRSVLDFIETGIPAEVHKDTHGRDFDVMRLYNAIDIDGKVYRVKSTVRKVKEGDKYYTYEVQKMELIEDTQEALGLLNTNDGGQLNSTNSISGAKLLKGVKKTNSNEEILPSDENIRNDAEIIAEVERESANLGVQVRIARSIDELPDADTRKRAEDGSLKGVYSTRNGEVVVYLPNTDDANDAKRTILHEIVGHKGLRQLIGEQRYDKAMLQLMYMLPADVRDEVLRRAERHGWNAAIAMDEYLAEQAERDVQPTWWGKVNAKIRALLRNMGFNVMLTDADVTYLLWRSRKKLQGDTAFDMATDAILKQAARKSAEAEAWNEQAFKDVEMRDFERNALHSIRHRMGADTNDYEKTVRTLGFKQSEAWQDSMRSLLVFQQALAKASGKDISDFENAYMYENRMSSANLMEMEQYRHMVYNPLLKEIHELEQMGASREDIINYLFAKSGLERNEVFARRDAKKHAEGDAAKEQQLYDKYRQKDYAGLTALTRGDAQIAALVDDHSDKKTKYDRLEQNKKRGVAVSDADLKAAKKEMDDARKAMITAIEAEAQRMVDEFERVHNTDNLWDKIRNCTHTTLNISHDAGVMSDEVYNELWNQFQYYIPLRGFAETTAEDVYLYLGGSDSPYNAPIKTAYGRTSLADDPIATIGNMAESAIVEANRNRLKQRFLYMVERHNTDLASISDVWLEYDEVNDEWHTVFAQIPDDATPSEAKRLQQEFEDRMKQLAEQNPGKYANASQQPSIPYRVVKKGDRQEHHVIVKRDGKDVVITINGNPRVAQAINGLTNPEQNQGMITRITSWINRNLSANFTMRNPAFMVSNFVRDGFYTNSMVWVKENPAYAWQYNQNWMKCTAQIASLVSRYKRYEKGDTGALDINNDMDRMFYEFMINGGETGYTVIKSVEDYKGLISGEMKKMEAGAMGTARRVADKIGDVVDTFGRWAEDTSRFAAYMTSRQLGRTVTKSIWDAKEISVNFNKKGSGNRMMGKFEQGNRLNYVLSNMSQLGRNLYVFWNAGVQGFNNFKKAAKDSPAKFTAMAGTYFTLGVIVAAAFSGDDDEDDYYNLPEYVRRNNICFKIGKGKYATLPLPIEIRAIYGLGELAYSYLSGREGLMHGEAVTKIIQQMTQVMPIDMMADGGGAMAFVPSAAKPVVEVIHNVDWTGRPIYKEKTPWNQNDPTWTLAFKSTNPELVKMSRRVNEWTNKNTADGLERPYNRGWADNRYLNNPAVWEHIAEGYLGGMATMFNQSVKSTMALWNEDLREVRNVPIVSRFVKDAGKEGRSYAARNEYYEAKNIMDSWRNEMSKAKKEVLDGSLTDQQRVNAAKLRSSLEAQYAEAFAKWKDLDKQRDNLEKVLNTDMSDQAKEEARKSLDDVMMHMATLVDAYR